MITLDDIRHFDIKRLDPTRLDLTRFDLRTADLPRLPTLPELPTLGFPRIQLPTGRLPKVQLPAVDVAAELDRVAKVARDAAYVGVGAFVVGGQKLDEQRRALTDEVAGRVRRLADAIA